MVALQTYATSLVRELGLAMYDHDSKKGNTMKDIDWVLFGKRLKARRESKGYTQQDVETNTGMSLTYYGNWERGTKKPGVLNNLYRVCAFLETDADYFLGLSDVPKADAPQSKPREYTESEAIADIADRLPASSRKQMLAIARMMADAADDWRKEGEERNKRVASMLKQLIGAISAGGEFDPADFTSIIVASEN